MSAAPGDALPRQRNVIYHLELLWPVAAAFLWREHMAEAYPIFYEDNQGAQHSLLNGFSSDFFASFLLGLFWGAAAAQASRPWVARVASADNPADCLTKPGLSQQHLDGVPCEDPALLEPFWSFVTDQLCSRSFPRWASFVELLGPRVQ